MCMSNSTCSPSSPLLETVFLAIKQRNGKIDTENIQPSCQIDQCTDIHTGLCLAQGPLNPALSVQDHQNIIYIEQHLPSASDQLRPLSAAGLLSRIENLAFDKTTVTICDERWCFPYAVLQTLWKWGLNVLIPERNENRKEQKAFQCHDITYSKLLPYK